MTDPVPPIATGRYESDMPEAVAFLGHCMLRLARALDELPVEIDSLNRSLGSYATAGQLQQRPSPAEGGILKRHWWRYWQPAT